VIAKSNLEALRHMQVREVVSLRYTKHKLMSQLRSDLHRRQTGAAMQTFNLGLTPFTKRGSVPQSQTYT
jgi:hypothetical protein